MSTAFFWLFIALLALGTPVVFALLIGPGLSLVIDGQPQFFATLLSRFYNGVDSFPLLAVPFFILAGELMNSGGITRSIVHFSQSLIGHVRGGLAQVNIVSSMLFAGISGSAVADASAIGKMLVPAMEQNGYKRSFAAAVTAAAAVMGPIIPPSGIMVLYGFVMNVSIGALFAAGVVPGVMIGLGLMLTTRVLATRYNLPVAARRATWRERGDAFRKAVLALVMPLILLGGMLSGYFTATEAAAVAAGYAMIVAPFVLRTVGLAEMRRIFVATAMQSGVILTLVGAAVTFAWLITVSGMAEGIAAAMLTVSDSPTVLLFLANLLLLLIGMFLDAGPAILILGPVLAPIFAEIGVHPGHFPLVLCINLTLRPPPPPMGLVLFGTPSVPGVRIESIVRQMLPYLAMEILVLLLVTFIPALTLALPRALGLVQ